MKRFRSHAPSMRYTDVDGNRCTLTYTQAIALVTIGRGERLHCTATSIHYRTALSLAEAGLIHFSGAPGEWEIQGVTDLGERVAEEYEARRKL